MRISLTKTITFALAIVLVLAVWRSAEGTSMAPSVQLQTSFDFTSYPTCGPAMKSNCIVAIRFYDSDSNHLLATAPTAPDMTGRHVIVATAHASSVPRTVYAATVYLDDHGQRMEGPHGPTSEYGRQGVN